MSKMSELSMSLDELTACGKSLTAVGERLIKAANSVRDIFSDTAANVKPEPQSDQPEPVRTYTFADVRKAFAAKSHAGYTEQVKALIGKYGADRLSAVKEEDYTRLMEDLEAIV